MKALILPAALVLALGALPAASQVLGPPRDPAEVQSSQGFASQPLDTLRSLGLTPLGEIERKREHLEVEARAQDGRRLWVSFDLTGRLWEIEDANHSKDHVAEWRPLAAEALQQAVSRAGFTFQGLLEEKKHHVVVRARARDGANMALHIDRNGYIYKQVWLRGWL
ncbi:hypothetical protein [Phreatobacter sp.]|uniref:hypothetical protein n=1 Tax=Phreatobacter sp. TaxID=1966341 RepID=UPI003F7073BA